MILDLYNARSESAIKETSEKYGGYCLAIANKILFNREDSEECVNDTYLHTWNAIPPQYPAVFRTFLGKITRNLALNKFKLKRTKKRGGGEVNLLLDELEECISSGNTVEKEYESGVVTEAINSFLLSLDKESRIIFVKRYWYADAILSIASEARMSESKIKSNLFRTRKKFRQFLYKEGVLS